MADVDDRWFKTVEGPDGKLKKVRSARYGKGKRWRARWRDLDGEQREKSFERKTDAEDHLSKVKAEMLAGRTSIARPGR